MLQKPTLRTKNQKSGLRARGTARIVPMTLAFLLTLIGLASLAMADSSFTLTVTKGGSAPLTGQNVYVFTGGGSYTGTGGQTDASGQVAFTLADGQYRFRVDTLGHQYWTPVLTVPDTLAYTFEILHQDVTVTVEKSYSSATEALTGVNTYLFTAGGSYLGVSGQTDANGQVVYNVPTGSFKVRADWLTKQVFSTNFDQGETRTITFVQGQADITFTQGGSGQAGVNTYVFTASGSYLGISGQTDANGQVSFVLPTGTYKFRCDYQGSQFWSDETTLTQDTATSVAVDADGGDFVLTVTMGAGVPLTGKNVYVFSDTGSYLGISGQTDGNGEVSFSLAGNGESYKFRVDLLGHQYWTPVQTVPDILAYTFEILHQDVTVTVEKSYSSATEALIGVNTYLFTAGGSYLGVSGQTDANGQVVYNVPTGSFKVRADWLTKQVFSTNFDQGETRTITFVQGQADITFTQGGSGQAGVNTYVFTASGSYLGISGQTDANGQVSFVLPTGTYKFRCDYQGSQFWSDETTLTQDTATSVAVDADGGDFVLTVTMGAGVPLTGKNVYVFSDTGSYLGISGQTDGNGEVSFSLAGNGESYKFRVDLLGHQYWTPVQTVPDILAYTFEILHQDVTVTVEKSYSSATEALIGVNTYLFTAGGSYLGVSGQTDANGQVVYNVPTGSFKVRADWLTKQVFSTNFDQGETRTITFAQGRIQVLVQDGSGVVTGANVYCFTASGSYLGLSAQTDGNGHALFTLPVNPYKFRADHGGGQYWSDEVSAVADQQVQVVIGEATIEPPVITSPTQGSWTNDSTPVVSGTALADSTVKVYEGTTLLGSGSAAGGSFSIELSTLADGSHTIHATATDTGDNESENSDTVTFNIDTEVPAAPAITAPTEGQVLNTSQPTISGTAEAGSTVEVFDGPTSIGTVMADGTGAFSFTPVSALADGSHTFTATATDQAGNTSSPSTGITVHIITAVPPVPSIASPTDASYVTSTTPTVTGAAQVGATVEILIGGGEPVASTTADGTGNFSVRIFSPLMQGEQQMSARATNSFGTSDSSSPITITVDSIVPPAPVFSVNPSSASPPEVVLSVQDIPSEDLAGYYFYRQKEGETDFSLLNASPQSELTFTDTDVLWGSPAQYYATAVDQAGNTSPKSEILFAMSTPPVLLIRDGASTVRVEQALKAWGGTYIVKDIEDGICGSCIIHNLNVLIWVTGGSADTITPYEEKLITDFLDAGGSLLFISNEILYDRSLCPFVMNYLHVQNYMDNMVVAQAVGVTDDPISDGMSLTFSSAATDFADRIIPGANAVGILDDTQGNYLGLRFPAGATGTHRVVFLAFNVERVHGDADPSNVNTLIKRSIEFLDQEFRVKFTSPEDGAVGVSLDKKIYAFFGQHVDSSTLNATTVHLQKRISDTQWDDVQASIAYEADNMRLVLEPTENLPASSTLRVVLGATIRAQYESQTLGTNHVFSFETAAGIVSGTIISADNENNEISTDTTWTLEGSPYIIRSNVLVHDNVNAPTLTIEPGVIVKFDRGESGETLYIRVDEGRILAEGTSAENIYFTSLRDDSIGGDTNKDGYMTTASKADWAFIHVGPHRRISEESVFRRCVVAWGGCPQGMNKGQVISVLSASPTFEYCKIYSSETDGIYLYEGLAIASIANTASEIIWITTTECNPRIFACEIYDCCTALIADRTSFRKVEHCSFHDNIVEGAVLYWSPTAIEDTVFERNGGGVTIIGRPVKGAPRIFDCEIRNSRSRIQSRPEAGTARGAVHMQGYPQENGIQMLPDDQGYPASLLVSGTTISGNYGWGIFVMDGYLTAHGNNIAANKKGGVSVASLPNGDARYNWWGHETGPGDEGPGYGDGVKGNVDYLPWMKSQVGALKLAEIDVSPLRFSPPSIPGTQIVNFAGTVRFKDPNTGDTTMPGGTPPQWTIVIKDGFGVIVNQWSGEGESVSWWWDGCDGVGQPVSSGTFFTFEMFAQAGGYVTAPAYGRLDADSSALSAKISNPAPMAILPIDASSNIVNISGSAAGSTFQHYELRVKDQIGRFVTLNGADTDYQYTAVVDGHLGTWNLSSSHFTSYSLHPNVTYRLEVNDGNTSIYAYRTARLYFATNLTGLWTKFSKDSGGIPLIDFHYRFSMLSDYTLDIVMIPGDVVVRTYHGTGMELREAWDGRDMAGMPLMDGQYEGRLRAEEKESGSGVQIVLHPETLFWDTAGPTVSFVTPIDGSTVHDSVSVGVVVWDAVSSNLTVDLFYGSGSTPGDDDYIMIDNQTWDTNYVPNGSYTLKAVATDQAGNSTTALIHVEVENLLDITEFSISEQIIDPHMNTTITWWVIPTGGASVQVKLVHICQYTKTQTEIRSWDFPNCPPGASTQVWDGTKEDDSIAPPGEYRVVIEASSGAITCTLGNTPDLPGTVPFTTTAAGGSGTRGGMNFTGPGSFKLQMILQAKGVLFITPVAAFSGAGSISQASPRYGAASKYSSEHASEKVALPASEREIEFMNLDGQGRILVSKAGAGGERSKNIDPETGQSRYLPSATPSTESGAPCAGLYQGQAGFKTSDANPTFVPPGGLGWVSINMSASTIDRNAIWLKGERTDILIDVFPKVLTARYNAVCNITLKSSSSNEVEADLKVLAGKIYTSQQSAIADGDPPVVRTLLTGHAIQPGGQVEVLWDTKDDEGRILRQGLYVIMLVLKKDGYECRVFRKIIVH